MARPLAARAFTIIEVLIAAAVIAVLVLGVVQFGMGLKRSSTKWTTAAYTVAPQTIAWSPGTGSFVLSVTNGVGVDANGQPAGPGRPLPGFAMDFQLIGSGGDTGVIVSLNGTAVNATTGSATSDVTGSILIVVEVDGDGPYVLVATDPASGGEERTLFIAGP